MNTKLSLNRTQLKIIAIISMVIDHTAWGFVDFYSPLGQFLHVCGRMTIPIMCFFIAEGFRKTTNLKKYIYRMAFFAVVASVPFYIFFHEEYDYRQNIIFDLLLGLLLLTVLESKKLKKWAKVLLAIALFVTSATIGGWIITPMLFILAFYYGKTFKEKAKWFIIADLATVAFLVVAILLNSRFHFAKYEWVWWDKFYLLGFMLALPLLYCYNGEKGKDVLSRYFFYCFYPAHFLVLAAIKVLFVEKVDYYYIYLGLHIVGLLVMLGLIFLSARAKPSRGQSAVLLFESAALIYVAGFIVEILSNSVEGVYLACVVQYLGEYLTICAVLFFVGELCTIRIPQFIYMAQLVIGMVFMYFLLNTRQTGLFYASIDVDFSGPFSKPALTYGPIFFVSMGYLFLVSLAVIILCVRKYLIGSPLEKKRLLYIMISLVCCWIPYLLKLLGLTGGYEIPAIGIACAGVCVYLCLIRYGFFNSVVLASSNALDHGREGILVMNSSYVSQYQNKMILDIFGRIPENKDLRKLPIFDEVLNGKTTTSTINGRTYDFVIEPLMEGNYLQGHMLWAIDSTEHYEAMRQIQELATKDSLTGLLNRKEFQRLVEEALVADEKGALLMIDMDNFKKVNDQNGHQCGDSVLIALGRIMQAVSEEELFECRLGGDEFCGFLRGNLTEEEIGAKLQNIMSGFEEQLTVMGYGGITSLSIGAVMVPKNENPTFMALYSKADKVLYEAKKTGKRRYIIRSFEE